ncbi:polyketide cyclase [Thermopolyspora flexuosa]|jgi:uncharacterized membrane protein|uniref:Polyketide cyclase/dehydrase/lipid transport protein n=1 Tax=Thermopolyspora flexuosa TaxID=103836 RepID=A0A543IPQ3_9ACTN|nr:SRPBCC family protein [Thermopolyspora flexuosa]TQM72554.1 polyketide cyclase/dehydrase/lipid transport protein [Thermopolyspora flexuosa]GGM69627.1 polyketide cyclase [Thermopolyspora flexuosa]
MTQDVKERPAEQQQETTGAEQPLQRLGHEMGNLVGALGRRAMSSVVGRVTSATGRLQEYAGAGEAKETGPGEGGGGPLRRAGKVIKGVGSLAKGITQVREGLTGKGGQRAQGSKMKVTNVVETIDIGAPVEVVYNQWTRFEDFPSFLKKVEHVEQESDERLTWKAQILWSHRSWQSEIIEQVPDERIIWRSRGDKGYVDGAVTFHPLAPNLTRVVLVLEYHPQGFFEHVGNLWRAQGRRARLELKHFRRHVMTQTLLHPEEVKGWRGTIHEGHTVPEEETGEQTGEQGGAGPEKPAADQPAEPYGEQTGPEEERKEPTGGEERAEATSEKPGDEQAEARDDRPSGEKAEKPEEPTGEAHEERAGAGGSQA